MNRTLRDVRLSEAHLAPIYSNQIVLFEALGDQFAE